MYSVLNIGKSGLKTMQYKMDSVANDIANVNTNGYKSKSVSFQELLNNGDINAGSKSNVGKINFKQGSFFESHNDYHMAIIGEGFFGVIDEADNLMLTRNGGFHRNEDGIIADDNGYPVVIDYMEPAETWGNNVSISTDGTITNNEGMILGKIALFRPENLDSLISLGEGKYLPSGDVELYDSMEDSEGFGEITQYFLEGSNVDIVESLADMITTQRAYSLNSKAVQTTDDIMNLINGIKR